MPKAPALHLLIHFFGFKPDSDRSTKQMIDRKHRKASNLNKYHRFWDEHYTGSENFFYVGLLSRFFKRLTLLQWLDHGAGKDIDLEECPRDRLETQQVVYGNSSPSRLTF